MDYDKFKLLLKEIIDGSSIETFLKTNNLDNSELQEYLDKTVGTKDQLEKALDKRSDHLFELLITWAKGAQFADKNEVPQLKLGIDTLKWAITARNPDKFAGKPGIATTEEGQVFLLDTGIKRETNESESD